MDRVGVVGLGTMGGRIAARLLDAGYQVHATNRTPAKAPLVKRGLHWHDTLRAVAAAADVVLGMVTDDTALAAVTGGPDGILAGLAPSTVYIDLSSVSPQASRQTAAQVHVRGAWMLDAPVSGSVPQAEQGRLVIMVGGEKVAFRRVEPLLARLGDPVTHIGGNGAGVLLKLAINISLAVQTLAFSESLLLAERGGIDPRLAGRRRRPRAPRNRPHPRRRHGQGRGQEVKIMSIDEAFTCNSAILAHRAISYWLPTLPGLVAYVRPRGPVDRWRSTSGGADEGDEPSAADALPAA